MPNKEDIEERNRELQEKQRAVQFQREAEVRPSPIHRALLFLLSHAVQNNPDIHREASVFIQELDQSLTDAAPEQLATVDKSRRAAAAPAIPAPTPNANQSAAEPANEPPDTSAAIRTSSRFGGRGGPKLAPRVQRPAELEPPAKPSPASSATRKATATRRKRA